MASNHRTYSNEKEIAEPSRDEMMAMFDSFSPRMRRCLAEAKIDYSIYQVWWNLYHRTATEAQIIAAIEERDRQLLTIKTE